jgi:hypothetical protein
MLRRTLAAVWQRCVDLDEIERLDITLYQEGTAQRVWRVQSTLTTGISRAFGMIVARALGTSSDLTQHDFANLQQLWARQPHYCVTPYVCGMLPAGVAAYTVEWLEMYKELVFDMTRDGGVFVVNAPGAYRQFSLQMSRHIWRRIVDILWAYSGLQAVNIQAGDFVGRVEADGREITLKLTTARQLGPDPGPARQIHEILTHAITASGYLSDGQRPFDRHMPQAVFLARMHAILQRRFGDHAHHVAHRQWELFTQGAFAQQEDWLKADCILATYGYLRHLQSATSAWHDTCQRWMAYAAAVHTQHLPPSWWFPAAEVPVVLAQVAQQLNRR